MSKRTELMNARLDDFVAQANAMVEAEANDENTWRDKNDFATIQLGTLFKLPCLIEREEHDEDETGSITVARMVKTASEIRRDYGEQEGLTRALAILPPIWIADVEGAKGTQPTRYLVDGYLSIQAIKTVFSDLSKVKTSVNVHIIYHHYRTVLDMLDLVKMVTTEQQRWPRHYTVTERISACARTFEHYMTLNEKGIPMPGYDRFADAFMISKRSVNNIASQFNTKNDITTVKHHVVSKLGNSFVRETKHRPNQRKNVPTKEQDVAESMPPVSQITAPTSAPVSKQALSKYSASVTEVSFRDGIELIDETNVQSFLDLCFAPVMNELENLRAISKKLNNVQVPSKIAAEYQIRCQSIISVFSEINKLLD